MTIATRLAPLTLLLALPLVPQSAGADEKNPEVEACEGKAEGNPCSFGRPTKGPDGQVAMKETKGVCRPDECCELDYSKGSSPDTKCGPCLACKAGPPVPTPDAPTPKSPDGDGGAAGEGGDGAAAGDSDPPETSPGKRGCSIGGGPGGLGGALLGVFVLAALGRRRR